MKARFINAKALFECDFYSPALISDLLSYADENFRFPCGKKGICGKCKVKLSGKASPLSESEKELLTDYEIRCGIRLACCTFALGDVTVEYDPHSVSFSDFLIKCREELGTLDKEKEYSAVFDIGTTTVKTLICDIAGNDVKEFSFINPQVKYGDNVISRMEYFSRHGGDELSRDLNGFIKLIFEKLKIKGAVVTGNTAMLHLLSGSDVSGMIKYPFEASTLFGFEKGGIYYPYCISSFSGADILCAALAVNLCERDNTLLIDIGTNGEIMFNHGGKIYSSSVAAGPAFEGYGIKFGSGAQDKAVNRVYQKDGEIAFDVIGNRKPETICGSGIIDAAAVMLDMGIIKKDGFLEKPYRLPKSDIYIFPEDIRALQLAKSAVCSGIMTLCNKIDEIDNILVCGNFGKSLDIENCINIGLLPDIDKDKYIFCGNAALRGAKMLLDTQNRKKLGEIRERCISLNFAEDEKFQKLFIENINF